MAGIHRKTDNCTGHGCWPPRPSANWSPNVFVNSLNVERYSDPMQSHCCVVPCHSGTHLGKHNVYANGLDVQTCGDPIDCGSACGNCSGNTFVNG